MALKFHNYATGDNFVLQVAWVPFSLDFHQESYSLDNSSSFSLNCMKIKSKKKSEKCLEKTILAGDFRISANKWNKCLNNSLYFQCYVGMQCCAFSV